MAQFSSSVSVHGSKRLDSCSSSASRFGSQRRHRPLMLEHHRIEFGAVPSVSPLCTTPLHISSSFRVTYRIRSIFSLLMGFILSLMKCPIVHVSMSLQSSAILSYRRRRWHLTNFGVLRTVFAGEHVREGIWRGMELTCGKVELLSASWWGVVHVAGFSYCVWPIADADVASTWAWSGERGAGSRDKESREQGLS
jgi:hypothetical protein